MSFNTQIVPGLESTPILKQTNEDVLCLWFSEVSGHVSPSILVNSDLCNSGPHRPELNGQVWQWAGWVRIWASTLSGIRWARQNYTTCLWRTVQLWKPVAERFLTNAWLSRLTCKSPCPYRLLQMYPFCSVAMNSSRWRATTPIDFCVCHLWPARITLQIYTPPDPEKCFQLPPAGVNLLCWADWNGTPRTLDKATKLRHRATATAATAINNIQVWLAWKFRSAVRTWISECGWFSRGSFFFEELWCRETHEILSPCGLGLCVVHSDALEVMFTTESHMTAKAEPAGWWRWWRLPLICFYCLWGFNNTFKCLMFWFPVFSFSRNRDTFDRILHKEWVHKAKKWTKQNGN